MLSATVLKVILSVIIMHLSELRLSLTFNRSFTIVGSDSEMCVLIFLSFTCSYHLRGGWLGAGCDSTVVTCDCIVLP